MFGWGKKKEPEEPEGYLGELSERQQNAFTEFKKWINDNSITDNVWFTDTFFLKFMRARKFDVPKVIEMFTNYMKYRESNGIDTICGDYVFAEREQVNLYYPRGFCGVTKLGQPIYIERSGNIQADKVKEVCDVNNLWREYY